MYFLFTILAILKAFYFLVRRERRSDFDLRCAWILSSKKKLRTTRIV